MVKVKVRVLNAVVDGKGKGEELEINAKQAEYLAKIKYVEIVGEVKEEKAEKAEAPKKQTVKRGDK